MDMIRQIHYKHKVMKKILLVLAVLAVGATTASAQKVRVMSYNVHNCIGSDKVKDIDRCAEVIRQANPDVVAIQEVDSCTRRNKRYVLGELGEKAGYHAYFGPTIPYKGGKYGIGVLSKKKAPPGVGGGRERVCSSILRGVRKQGCLF